MIRITHTAERGSLVEGTSRGDGSNAVLKPAGWRWSAQLGAWYLPRSRDHAPRGHILEATRAQLEAAGHDVELAVDATRRSVVAIELDRQQHQAERADRLEQRAQRRGQEADEADRRARELGERIPLGQPILVGHHSERRHRADLSRIERSNRVALEAGTEAAELRRRAEAAEAATDVRYQPQAVARRITALEVERAQIQRTLHGYRTARGDTYPPADGEYQVRQAGRLSELEEQLEYWRGIRAEQVSTGQATAYNRADVAKGDLVEYRGSWYAVVRANQKSVSVTSRVGGSWTDTIPYDQLTGHRRTPQKG